MGLLVVVVVAGDRHPLFAHSIEIEDPHNHVFDDNDYKVAISEKSTNSLCHISILLFKVPYTRVSTPFNSSFH